MSYPLRQWFRKLHCTSKSVDFNKHYNLNITIRLSNSMTFLYDFPKFLIIRGILSYNVLIWKTKKRIKMPPRYNWNIAKHHQTNIIKVWCIIKQLKKLKQWWSTIWQISAYLPVNMRRFSDKISQHILTKYKHFVIGFCH